MSRWIHFDQYPALLRIGVSIIVIAVVFFSMYSYLIAPLRAGAQSREKNVNNLRTSLNAIRKHKKESHSIIYKADLLDAQHLQEKIETYFDVQSLAKLMSLKLTDSDQVELAKEDVIKELPSDIQPYFKAKLTKNVSVMVLEGGYFPIMNSLIALQKTIPQIHWVSLHYKVVKYPMAKVQVKFYTLSKGAEG